MKIENDRIVFEDSDLAGLSNLVLGALGARTPQTPAVQLTRHVNRLIDLAVKDLSAEQTKNLSDIAAALASDPARVADVLPTLNQVRSILGLDPKAQSAPEPEREAVTITAADVGVLKL